MVNLKRWLRRWYWILVMGIAGVGGFILFLFLPKTKKENKTVGIPKRKTINDRAKEEIERVKLEGEVEKARIMAVAETERKQLDDIEIIGREDPIEARKQLAFWISKEL